LQVVEAALQDAQLSVDAIDWLLLHQANQRILDSASQRLKVGCCASYGFCRCSRTKVDRLGGSAMAQGGMALRNQRPLLLG
jgi:3-oxoacyl-[acyl-carrier-protein] synthase III